MAQSVWDDWGVLPSAFHPMYTIPVKEEAMKVQLRGKAISCMEWEVADEAKAYYIAKDPAGFLRVLDKADYEPVQEWVDVTHECTLEASATGAYCIYRLGYVLNPGNTVHRVTCKGSTFKVEVKR